MTTEAAATVVPSTPTPDLAAAQAAAGTAARDVLLRRGRRFVGLAAAWLIADQLTKVWVLSAFAHVGEGRVLLPGLLEFSLTFNTGAAFGLLQGTPWSRAMFIVIACGALAAMWLYRRSIVRLAWPERLGLALVAGGAAGNLIDRLFRPDGVVDFIHFHIAAIGFDWPHFNVADIGVTCGMVLYVGTALITDWRHAAEPAPAPPSD